MKTDLFAPDDSMPGILNMLPKPDLGGDPAPVAKPAPVARTPASVMLAPQTAAPAQPAVAPAVGPVSDLSRFMELVRAHESGGKDNASSGVANGRYQFTPATWSAVGQRHPELGLRPEDVWNGAKQDLAMRAISQDYINVLHQNGLAPTMPNMFMLHFLGEGGGPKFLKAMQADPNGNAPAQFAIEAKYNPTIFYEKNGQPRTLSQVYALMTKSFGGPQNTSEIGAQQMAAAQPAAPVQVAEGPATTMTDATPPPPPPGLKLDTGAALTKDLTPPPPPPGLKLDYNAADPLQAKGGYTDKDGVYHPAVAPPPPPQNPPTRESVGLSSDLAEDQARMDAMAAGVEYIPPDKQSLKPGIEDLKGVAVGPSKMLYGGLSMLPDVPANSITGAIPVGSSFEKVLKSVEATGSPQGQNIGEAAAGLLPLGDVGRSLGLGGRAVESLWPAAGKAAIYSSGGSILRGGETPTPTQNPSGDTTWSERLGAKVPAIEKDAEISVPLSVAGPVVGQIVRPVLKGAAKVVGKTAGIVGDEVNKITGSAATKSVKEVENATRARVAAGAAGETAKLDEVARSEATADRLAKEFAARPAVKAGDFGGEIHEAAVKDAEALTKARKEQSGFEAAVNADGGKPIIPTKQFIAAIDDAEKGMVSDESKTMLKKLKDNLWTDTENGRLTGVSTKTARRIVQDLDAKIEPLMKAGRTDEAHEILSLKNKFVEHMEATVPDLKTARLKYAELSRPLDVYRDSGALSRAVLEDPYSSRSILDNTKIVGALLNRTDSGGEALGRLVAGDDKLKDSARKYFNQRLKDMKGVRETPTDQQFFNFLRDNEAALEKSGLKKEFEELAGANRGQRSVGELAAAKAKSEAFRKEMADFDSRIGTANDNGKYNKKLVLDEAKAAVEKLRSGGYLNDDEYKEAFKQVQDAVNEETDHLRVADRVHKIMWALAGGAAASAGLDWIHNVVSTRVRP